jgi:hypothetical protein
VGDAPTENTNQSIKYPADVDVKHLIEQIESMGTSERRELISQPGQSRYIVTTP